ncbi:MAG: NAD(P)/FAD-dependent oxidoreductase [Chitinophagaceae bacterium]|nr:NAD(P)/FAD-dependent oxidoreductase [Chitinophagaceae bacterium]
MRYAIIIGAGPAGLTAAYELLTKTDIIPIVFEQDDQPGGLSKTIDYKGNKIDIGGHRFFSKSEKVVSWWLHFLPLEPGSAGEDYHIHYKGGSASFKHTHAVAVNENQVMMLRPRKSRIYFQKKFFDYPLQLNGKTLWNLGMVKTIRIACSYIYAKLVPVKPEQHLADFFRNRFGAELYRTFFKDYTEKVWGVPCEKLPSTWGQQRVKDLNIGKVIKHAFKSVFARNTTIDQKGTSTSLIEQFMYPRFGPGQMWETVARAVEELGGKIHYHTTVTAVNGDEHNRIRSVEVTDHVTNEKKIYEGDYFFSTMPVKELVKQTAHLDIPPEVQYAAESLEYRDFLIVGILTSALAIKEKNSRFTDNWIYIQDRHIRAGRIQFFHNWSPYMIKDPDDIWIGVEYFCNESDRFWQQSDDAIAAGAISEMQQIGILNAEQVKDKLVVKVKKAYPSYFGGYNNFSVVQEFLDQIDNLYLIGRNGMHRYNNTDHSMLTAMEAVENIITGTKDKRNIWEINTEDVYHEEDEISSEKIS